MKILQNNLRYKVEFDVTYNTYYKEKFYVYVFENINSFEFYIQEIRCDIIELMFNYPVTILTDKEIEQGIKDNIRDYVILYMDKYILNHDIDKDLLKID